MKNYITDEQFDKLYVGIQGMNIALARHTTQVDGLELTLMDVTKRMAQRRIDRKHIEEQLARTQ